MVRRRVYVNAISDLIISLLNNNTDLAFLKTIAKGDLKLLPAPEDYPAYMPALFIDPTDVFNEVAIGKDVVASAYEFDITYVKYYEKDYAFDVKEQAITEAELIADTLMEDMDLNRIDLVEGRVLGTRTPHIGLSTQQNQIFENLKLPVLVIDINYVVYFRSIKR